MFSISESDFHDKIVRESFSQTDLRVKNNRNRNHFDYFERFLQSDCLDHFRQDKRVVLKLMN